MIRPDELEPMGNDVVANVDIAGVVADFVHHEDFFFFAVVCRGWRHAWGGRAAVTRAVTPFTSASQLGSCFKGGLEMSTQVRA